MSVPEEAPCGKGSVVREAIEAGLDYALTETALGYPPLIFWGGPDRRQVERLLRAAWLSLPKCVVCGREEGYENEILDASPMSVPPQTYDTADGWWHEPVCSKCRQHPSIHRFEEF